MQGSTPHSWNASAIDLDTEEGRALYQERLALLGKIGFLLSAALFLMRVASGPRAFVAMVEREGGGMVQVGKLLVFLLAWLVCRRRRVALPDLRAIDGALPFLVLIVSAIQVTGWPEQIPGAGWAVVLALTNVLMTRAVVVPSPPRRTFWIGLGALPPVLAVAMVPRLMPGPAPGSSAIVLISALVWSLCALVLSTMTSAIIYGLRNEVREARQLGQYTLERKLGEGGMGVVYRARHAMLRRPTAVKLLPADKAGEASIRRFEREVQLTAQLSHPNTISIFDYGRTADGVFFYAMEYLEGVNLEELVKQFGPQAPARVVHILRQVAGSLAEAHGAGLIHRDIKPANILVCERGGVADVAKVLDFGLARDVENAASPAVTQVDAIAGTPLYLSPEAITSPETADARSDLYALGAVAYYLLTGTTVFEARTVVEVCSHHLHTRPVPPSSRLGRSLPRSLESLVLSCLEKDARKRPQSALDFAARLPAGEDVGGWSDREARGWWDRHAERVRAIREESGRATASTSGSGRSGIHFSAHETLARLPLANAPSPAAP